jgi:aminopeptidase N
MKKILLTLLFGVLTGSLLGQNFTKEDTLRGAITPERAWWDLQHYDLDVEVNPKEKSISGTNTITYLVLKREKTMQIELQEPMQIDKVVQNGRQIYFKRNGTIHLLKLKKKQIGQEAKITIYFSGTPKEAVRAPWDGGFSWSKDSNGNDFIATSNQGIGSSVWWPNKDHPADEPDKGVDLSITAPSNLTAVGNGRLLGTKDNGKTKTWDWQVKSPINNYGVNINIGDYVNFTETFEGLDGNLDMSYWVLKDNLEKAKDQFTQAPMMMQAFEYWFGPYPFYQDSFKLVEVPYLGMEHQSSVTYGNKYQNGYLGRDLSGTGWGLRFDFIIIHEAGHEWFANSITNKDVADMWIHESFTAYSENLYLNYHYSDEASSEYLIGTRKLIQNDKPIIGQYNLNNEGSGTDMYYKGANILHTVRQLVNDDKKWRTILRGLNTEFRHKTVTSKQVEEYISTASELDLSGFWDQYLRTTSIPTFEYQRDGQQLTFRYANCNDNFSMPLELIINGNKKWVTPTSEWRTADFKSLTNHEIRQDFYINTSELTE